MKADTLVGTVGIAASTYAVVATFVELSLADGVVELR